jgi:MiaB-like tRNA modifying enzyme
MKIGILTYGCAMNQSDSELMASLLSDSGFEVIMGSEEPELIVVNTCIVKGPTENKVIRKLQDLEKAGKKVIIAGCMPEAYPELIKRFPDFAVLGVNSFDVVEVVNSYLAKGAHRKVGGKGNKNRLKKVRLNPYVEIVPISEGCLGSCSYCSAKLARGNLRSFKPELILDEIKGSVKCGVREVWLTSQDNGCYGLDAGTNLVELLRAVLDIPGDFKVRVGMMNPAHIPSFLDELIEIYKNGKIFKFLHIPVQSGSDRVLKEMNRGYTTNEFEEIVSKFRGAMDLTISTDIIVGYPTETEEDFRQTLDLLKRTQPEFLNLSKYWPRKKTPAGEMKQLPRDIIGARSKKVADLFSKNMRDKNKKWVGKKCSVTFIEKRDDYSVGRNSLYRPVLVKGGDLLGKTCSVKITNTKGSELMGELI